MIPRYVQAAIDAEIAALRDASSGRRCLTFRAAAAVGNFVGSGVVDREEAESLLLDAATETGLSQTEALSHIRRGLRRGELTPRSVPETPPGGRSDFPSPQPAPKAPFRQRIDDPVAHPPKHEVYALWDASMPIGSDPEVRAWFCSRYHSAEEHTAAWPAQPGDAGGFCHQDCHRFWHHPSDVPGPVFPSTSNDLAGFCHRHRPSCVIERVELWDLCRAIPADHLLPRWAWSRGGPWTRTGHRALFRLWDYNGRVASVRARCIDPTKTPKSLAPAGFSIKGLVLADSLGVQLLAGAVPDWWDPQEIVISEGELDWCTWATRQRDSNLQGPACFGIEAGAWTEAIAERIPEGAAVALRTDHDQAGDHYAEQIAMTLRRRCRLFRSQPEWRTQ